MAMVVEAATQPSKLRWGELEVDDGEDLDFLLPPKQVLEPDENGIKKVVEYKFSDEGNKVKITTATRIRKLANARLSKRPSLATPCMRTSAAASPWFPLKRFSSSTHAPGTKQEETKVSGDHLAQMGKGGAVLMVCRTCGKRVTTGPQGALTRILLNQLRSLISYHQKPLLWQRVLQREHMFLQA